jgi:hypothetical protein
MTTDLLIVTHGLAKDEQDSTCIRSLQECLSNPPERTPVTLHPMNDTVQAYLKLHGLT